MAGPPDDQPSTSGGAAGQAPAAPAVPPAALGDLATLLRRNLGLMENRSESKQHYAFWSTQPVAQFGAEGEEPAAEGPIDAPKTVADVKPEPYKLPDAFEWCLCDLDDDRATMEVYQLLSNNYVEDDDNMFR